MLLSRVKAKADDSLVDAGIYCRKREEVEEVDDDKEPKNQQQQQQGISSSSSSSSGTVDRAGRPLCTNVHRAAAVDRPVDRRRRAVDRPVDRLTLPNSRLGTVDRCLDRSTDRSTDRRIRADSGSFLI